MSRFYTPWKRDIGLKWVNYAVAKYWKLAFKKTLVEFTLTHQKNIKSIFDYFISWLTLILLQIYIYSLWNAYVTWQEHTVKCTAQISTQNTAQSFGQFGQTVECSFTS